MKWTSLTLPLVSLPHAAFSAALVDPTDLGDADWRTLVISVGMLAAIACHDHRDIISRGRVTAGANAVCKWVFRFAIVLLLLPLLGRLSGFFWFDSDTGWAVLALWSCLRAAQALYLSGVRYGMREAAVIQKHLNEPRPLD